MFTRIIYGLLSTFLFAAGALGQTSFEPSFANCGFQGSVTMYDYKNQKWITSDSIDSSVPNVPASTFKIINLLIALETGVISDELNTVKWVGEINEDLYMHRPSTYKDMTVKEAFQVSAVWVFMELAKKIGREKYLHYLEASGYGNRQVNDESDFWNFGPLAISPRNQIEFLVKVYEGKTPFSQRNIEILKRVMINEKNDDYILRAKTGWGSQDQKDIGWWVGYVERKDNVYFFSTRITKDKEDKNPEFKDCRIDITKNALKEIGAL